MSEAEERRRAQKRAWHQAKKDRINQERREQYAANRDQMTQRSRDYYAANQEQIRARSNAYRAANREHVRERDKRYRGLYQPQRKAQHQAWLETNHEHVKKYRRAYDAANKERLAERRRNLPNDVKEQRKQKKKLWYQANRAHTRERNRASMLRRLYNMEPADFDDLLEKQNGDCPVCHTPLQVGKDCHIDHDHTTGKVRGLLHSNCNTSIGKLGDTAEGVYAAYLYLVQAEAQNNKEKLP